MGREIFRFRANLSARPVSMWTTSKQTARTEPDAGPGRSIRRDFRISGY